MKNVKIYSILITLIAALLMLGLLTACGDEETTSTETTPAESTSDTAVTTPSYEDMVLSTAYDDPEAYVSLPELSTITVPKAPIQKEVDAYIQDVLDSLGRADYKATAEGTAAILGDSLNIHYTGRAKDENVQLSSETIAGMSNASQTEGYDLVLGSGSFIPGFEEQLVGAKAGETVTIEVTFPDGYSEELSNLPVYFDVTVNSVSRATVSDKNVLMLTVMYSLKEGTETSELAAFMEGHEVEYDMRDLEAAFDEHFSAEAVRSALMGVAIFGTATVEVTMPLDVAKTYGYETEIVLSAMITVDEIVYYPEELTDEDIKSFTGGDYTTVKAFTDYVFNHYKCSHAYTVIMETATYSELNQEVYGILYDIYYDQYIYNKLGDISDLSEEELAEKLTQEIKDGAKAYADENATAEYKDRMLMSYLTKILNFTLTEEKYDELLQDLYDYYYNYYYMYLIYSGITDVASFEAYLGEDSLRFQFTTDEVITLLGEKVTFVD